MVLVRKEYVHDCELINSSANQQDGTNTLETTTVRFRPKRLPRGYSKCLVTCVYIPPIYNKQAEIDSLYNHLEGIYEADTSPPLTFVCGDFNKAKISSIKSMFDLYEINKKPTRKNNVLDLILSNAPKYYIDKTRDAIW